jgi:hypothetical protein
MSSMHNPPKSSSCIQREHHGYHQLYLAILQFSKNN